MLKTIDKRDGLVVQKITKPNGALLHYQVGQIGDASSFKSFPTLNEARQLMPLLGNPAPKLTKPKSEYAENQKGYRANRK